MCCILPIGKEGGIATNMSDILSSFFVFRVYVPCIYVLNKIDQISIEVSIFYFLHSRLKNEFQNVNEDHWT